LQLVGAVQRLCSFTTIACLHGDEKAV
jgi:hypothetical protein